MIGTKEIYKVGKGKIITIDQENIEGFVHIALYIDKCYDRCNE